MATGRTETGNAANAPMSVPVNRSPDGQHHRDLTAYLQGRREVTVKAKAKRQYIGYGPGDDMAMEPRTVDLAPGAVARLDIQPKTSDPQNAMTVAYGVARGWIDIVDDKEFDKAPTHDEVWIGYNKDRAERDLHNRQQPAAGSLLDVMAAQIAKLTAEVAALKGGAKA